jgi:DNA polymerase III sliding clamp (beta) subunit (PCNA family)
LAGTAHSGEIGYERLLGNELLEKFKKVRENYKIETNGKLFNDIVGRLSSYIIFITFYDGMRLKDIFLRALSGCR